MQIFKLIVMSNAITGREDEYNDWYNNRHLQDVVAVPGFLSAQRYRLNDAIGYEHTYRYVAIYELDSADAANSVADLIKRRGTEAMLLSDAFDLDGAIAGVFEPCSPVVKSKLV